MKGRSAVVLLVVTAACTLPDFDEYSSGLRDGGAPRAPDGGGPDDAGTRADAIANEASTLPQPSGCRAHPGALFCADFDQEPPFDGFSEVVTGTPRGTLVADRARFVSAPASLIATMPKRGDGKPNVYLDHVLDTNVPATLTGIRIGWSVRIDDPGGTQTAVDLGVSLSRGAPYRSLAIRYRNTTFDRMTFELFEFGDAPTPIVEFTKLSTGPALGRFQRFAMVVRQTATSSSVAVLVDGVLALPERAAHFHEGKGPPHLLVGVVSTDGPGEEIGVGVDDVVVEPL